MGHHHYNIIEERRIEFLQQHAIIVINLDIVAKKKF